LALGAWPQMRRMNLKGGVGWGRATSQYHIERRRGPKKGAQNQNPWVTTKEKSIEPKEKKEDWKPSDSFIELRGDGGGGGVPYPLDISVSLGNTTKTKKGQNLMKGDATNGVIQLLRGKWQHPGSFTSLSTSKAKKKHKRRMGKDVFRLWVKAKKKRKKSCSGRPFEGTICLS